MFAFRIWDAQFEVLRFEIMKTDRSPCSKQCVVLRIPCCTKVVLKVAVYDGVLRLGSWGVRFRQPVRSDGVDFPSAQEFPAYSDPGHFVLQSLGLWICRMVFRKGGWYGWKPSSSSNFSIRAFQAYTLSREQFEATVSQSTVPSPLLVSVDSSVRQGVLVQGLGEVLRRREEVVQEELPQRPLHAQARLNPRSG